ncbi:MAG: SRPBCC domain-containing protein [Leucobacter sp.]
MIPLGPVVARSRVRAARTAAWSYLVQPERRAAWWPELQLEPRLGGEVIERWSETNGDTTVSRDASGEVDVWVDGHALGFKWSEAGDEHSTAVLVTLRAQGRNTGITVTETGFDALPSAAERAAASQDGWGVLLRDLTAAIESGAVVESGTVVEPGQAVLDQPTAEQTAESRAETGSEAQGEQAVSEVARGSDLELAAPEFEGELEDDLSEGAEATLEVDAEPAVGDHPELGTIAGSASQAPSTQEQTGPEASDSGDADEQGEQTVSTDADDSGVDDSDAEGSDADDPSGDSRGAAFEEEEEELDFDALIRGDR